MVQELGIFLEAMKLRCLVKYLPLTIGQVRLLGNKTGAQVASLNVQTKDSWMARHDRPFKLF